MPNAMEPQKKTARIAGLLYLFVAITGPILIIYIPNKLFVPGDATATAQNILAHETLFRFNIILGIFSNLAFIAAVLYLYKLLRHVGQELALAMVGLILIIMPLAFLGSMYELGTLNYLKAAESLSVIDLPQRNAITLLLVNFDHQGILVPEMFWGLWLLPLGLLIYRSGFIARFIGVWLLINGFAYILVSSIGILLPEYLSLASKIAMPAMFGELVLMLWLVIVGVRIKPIAG